jgi:predicted Fe-Mo cluster-binding NifX family protein
MCKLLKLPPTKPDFMKSNLRFALAVNAQHLFESRHFGDAEKFLLYDYREGEMAFCKELTNPAKDSHHSFAHGSEEKAGLLTELFTSEKVDVLVSKKFGGNLKRVNRHFIPVIITQDSLEDALGIMQKHIHWLMEERHKRPDSFQLFQINQGILKTSVKQDKPLHRNMFF